MYFKHVIHLLFVIYTGMLFVRIALSWVPSLYRYRIIHFILFYTDPYLNIFRKVVPPIGGMLDLSPLLGFFFLRMLESFVMKLL
ncbi:MAG: YggT family protein [Chlamydiae bacterium]|nr:YggT family protein [Chlamydiota bacterium]